MNPGELRAVPTETKLVVGLVSGSEFMNHSYLVLLPPILGLLAADFGVSLALLGLALGLRGAATTAFQLPFGYLSDRRSRTLGLGLSLGLGSLGALLTAAAPTFWLLALGQVVIGIGVAGHHPSHFPLLSDAVSERYRARVFSVRGFAGALGFATPPAVITAVLAVPGTTWRHGVALLGVVGLAYTAVTLALFRRYVSPEVKRPAGREPDAADEPARSVGERVRREVRSIVSMPAILALALLTAVTALVMSAIRTYAVVHLTDGYGASLGAANLTLTAMFVAGAVTMLVGGVLADRFPAGGVMIAGYALLGVLLVAVASLVIPTLLAMGLLVATQGFLGAVSPARSKLVDRFASRSALGQSFAVMTVGLMLGTTVAPPLFGAAIETVGLRATFLAVAAVAFAALAAAVAVVVAYDESFSLRRSGTPSDD